VFAAARGRSTGRWPGRPRRVGRILPGRAATLERLLRRSFWKSPPCARRQLDLPAEVVDAAHLVIGHGGHPRGGPRRVRLRLHVARYAAASRVSVWIWRVHSRALPVGAASQNRHRVRCNRNRIPPFGPSAWPPRSSLHALVVVTAVSTRFRHRHLPQRLAESGARTSSASTNRGQRTPAHDRILAGGSGNRRSPAACCPAAVRIFWLRRHARPDEPARPRRTTRLPRRWR